MPLICIHEGRVRRCFRLALDEEMFNPLRSIDKLLSTFLDHIVSCPRCKTALTELLERHKRILGLQPPMSSHEITLYVSKAPRTLDPFRSLMHSSIPMRARYRGVIEDMSTFQPVTQFMKQEPVEIRVDLEHLDERVIQALEDGAALIERLKNSINPCYNCGEEMFSIWNSDGRFYLVHPGKKPPLDVHTMGAVLYSHCCSCGTADDIYSLGLPFDVETVSIQRMVRDV